MSGIKMCMLAMPGITGADMIHLHPAAASPELAWAYFKT